MRCALLTAHPMAKLRVRTLILLAGLAEAQSSVSWLAMPSTCSFWSFLTVKSTHRFLAIRVCESLFCVSSALKIECREPQVVSKLKATGTMSRVWCGHSKSLARLPPSKSGVWMGLVLVSLDWREYTRFGSWKENKPCSGVLLGMVGGFGHC